ncbi:hypothetical protein SCUCBS95973_008752 [Sporothrix curviconia]|uniref:Glucose-methanol-choline oxidoreductase N-terminal domain-containing protein n=1 Tax=Sporothrix curviconia TaxID=1260050 RepID=A0ABP0CSC8_9PEZI
MESGTAQHFDFVIVGGGTAGNVVAGRLAENPNAKILIIEAGRGNPENVPDIMTPAKAMELRGGVYDWAYKTTMVKRDNYERIEKPNTRVKALGGSSSLNYFTWIPGSKGTFDLWEKFGGKEWTWDPLVPYLRKSATYHDDEGLYDEGLAKIGAGGPLPVSHAELLPEMEGFRQALHEAWMSMGQPLTENIFDGEMIGLTHCVDSIYQGKRRNSVLFVRGKPNITILARTYSKQLVVDPKTKHVSDVVAIDTETGKEQTFYADREVIVAQGVFESPKLLMLSGIGPKAELAKHGIAVVVDSPHDGSGMDDHLLRDGPLKTAAVNAYANGRAGPLGSGNLEVVGFPRIDSYLEKDPTYGQPHFELDFVSLFGSAFQWHYPQPKAGSYTSVVVDLVRPVSSPGENELDIIAMREGIRFSYDLLTKGAGFKDLVVAEYLWDMPLDDDNAMRHAVLDRCQTVFHPCGSNRLSQSIQQGVVDPALRVHGVTGLRIIDASIIPEIPDCRIQNSVYMIGEKGADMIKTAHKDLY